MSEFNDQCTFEECIKQKGPHLFDVTSCNTEDPDETVELDPILLKDMEKSNINMASTDFYSYDSENNVPSNLIRTETYTTAPSSIEDYKNLDTKHNLNNNVQDAILEFLSECKSISFINAIKNNYTVFFAEIENVHIFQQYHKMFVDARVTLGTYPVNSITHFIIKFISSATVKDFVHFDLITKGATLMFETTSMNLISELTTNLETMVGRMHHHSDGILGVKSTIDDCVESLRESTNNIAASTKKLETEIKKLEISEINAQSQLPHGMPKDGQTVTQKINCYSCYPHTIAVADDKKVDIALTIKINKDLSLMDKEIIRALKECGPVALSLLMTLSWNDIKRLNPVDTSLDSRKRRDAIWTTFKNQGIPNETATLTSTIISSSNA